VNSYTQFMFNNLHECVLLNSKLFVENSPVYCTVCMRRKIHIKHKGKSNCSFGVICKSYHEFLLVLIDGEYNCLGCVLVKAIGEFFSVI
jgi:hypothetical protein